VPVPGGQGGGGGGGTAAAVVVKDEAAGVGMALYLRGLERRKFESINRVLRWTGPGGDRK